MNSLMYRVAAELLTILDGCLVCVRLPKIQAIRSNIYKFLFARCGKGLRLKCGTCIDAPQKVVAGKGLNIGEFTFIDASGGVTLGDDVIIGHHVSILSSTHEVDDCTQPIATLPSRFAPVMIQDNVWIGAGARILLGVTLGTGCVVGAGCVVTRDVPPYDIVHGVPARTGRNRRDCPRGATVIATRTIRPENSE